MKINVLTVILSSLILPASAQDQKVASDDVAQLADITTHQTGIPALLNNSGSDVFSLPDTNAKKSAPKSRQESIEASTLLKNIREQQAELGAQKRQIVALEAELKKQQNNQTATNEAYLNQIKTQLNQALAEKAQALTQLQQMVNEQKIVVEKNSETLKEKDKTIADLNLTLQDKSKALAEAQQKEAQKQLKPLNSNLQYQQSYAIGVSLGMDMQKLLAERASQGVKIDNPWLLAGVTDSFSGQYKMDEQARNKLLYDSAVVVSRSMKNSKEKAQEEGKNWLVTFRKNGGQKMDNGCWYKIDYQGKGAIQPDDKVSVVMKESLANGKVISDMEASGNVVTQPLKEYPPVFRTAISQLQNHGSMVLMVPPELAYGDKGLPPNIPPGSTMIYTLRIVDVSP